MANIRARITGKVLLTQKRQFGSGDRVFKFTEARIQTGLASIESVRYTDSWEHDFPRAGDAVDLDVEVSGFGGRSGVEVTATAVQPFDESYIISLMSEHQAA